jgi:large subunit ribosomal protein L30
VKSWKTTGLTLDVCFVPVHKLAHGPPTFSSRHPTAFHVTLPTTTAPLTSNDLTVERTAIINLNQVYLLSLQYRFPLTRSSMPYFRITLIRSSIGLPRKTNGVLAALGLRRRMQTVFHPVTTDVAGQIMKVKELVAVSEVEKAMTPAEMRAMRKPDPGYYVERIAEEVVIS